MHLWTFCCTFCSNWKFGSFAVLNFLAESIERFFHFVLLLSVLTILLHFVYGKFCFTLPSCWNYGSFATLYGFYWKYGSFATFIHYFKLQYFFCTSPVCWEFGQFWCTFHFCWKDILGYFAFLLKMGKVSLCGSFLVKVVEVFFNVTFLLLKVFVK